MFTSSALSLVSAIAQSFPSLVGSLIGGALVPGSSCPACAPVVHCPAPRSAELRCHCDCGQGATAAPECPAVNCRHESHWCGRGWFFGAGLILGFLICIFCLVLWRGVCNVTRRLGSPRSPQAALPAPVPLRRLHAPTPAGTEASSPRSVSSSGFGPTDELVTTWQPRRRR